MKRRPTSDDGGYALRAGKFMKGPKPLQVDPEVFERCLSIGFSSGEVPIPAPIGDRILRLSAFLQAHRTLQRSPFRRNPHGPA